MEKGKGGKARTVYVRLDFAHVNLMRSVRTLR